MEEWEEASDDEIWFKNMNDINQTCGIWPVTWQCNNDDKDWGKPRFRIERHSAATFAHVNRLGAGLGTSVLQYDPWDNDSLASVNETPYPEGSWSRNVVSSLTIYTSNYSSTAIIKYDGINSYFNTYSDNGPLLRTTHYVNNYRTINGIRFNQFNRTMRHELGHILGLIHEHQRDDRNNYIYRGVVPHDNSITGGGYSVTGGCSGENSSQFDIWPHGTDDLTTYDYDSVMHYWDDGRNCYSVFRKCNNSYANCPYGGYSIDARIIYRNTTAKLSPKDIQGIQELYD